MSPGRIEARILTRSALDLALFSLISFLRSFSPIAMGASDVVSVPPPMPESIWPSAILLAT